MEVVAGASELPLPESFLEFLNQNGLDPSIYAASQSTPRYIRLKPGCKPELAEIETEMKCKLEEVCWLPDFYYLPPDVRIASTKAYQEGKIYGIDASSGAAVLALDISPGDHVLDLCAAPGAKLCMILDLLGGSGSVTGVDVARHRLAASRTMLQKYALGDQCRLLVADGTTFSLTPLRAQSNSKSCNSMVEENSKIYNEWTPRRPWKERKRIAKASKTISQIEEPELIFYGRQSGVVGLSKYDVYRKVNDHEISQFGYDKVLVDAECTHDGSIKHIQKFEQWGWTTLPRRVLDAERTDDLTVLQLKLLINGFRLLKVGGSLVYSTCSLTVAQNEDVVERFLLEHTSAKLLEIDAAKNWPCRQARIPKALRFDPLTSSTSGLFVAKFTKLNA
ncbi:S-adenosyl-L-methionine-dependent methyltransferases superfamily protein [Perilla frutescens var. hirtella]|uniref:S-adenosyl-L-methionine-dependent methyltransferases superfamily protein n=1 Tax=Perilla frutescens var. hirtella TaxID=608512 RepID=A0AAD4JNW6_PERFH|nr:S-adenosyl-L-methionine-dependent methyltransferases superfamily protein [Perilla frutescens var. hirtella]